MKWTSLDLTIVCRAAPRLSSPEHLAGRFLQALIRQTLKGRS
jgi:hypothetical protein